MVENRMKKYKSRFVSPILKAGGLAGIAYSFVRPDYSNFFHGSFLIFTGYFVDGVKNARGYYNERLDLENRKVAQLEEGTESELE